MLATAAAAAVVSPTYASFYDALVADRANHGLLLSAIAGNSEMTALLKTSLNLTAFVPTDKAFIAAALKYKLPLNPTKLKDNACLINAILRYHIVAPAMRTGGLAHAKLRKTQLVVAEATSGGAAKQVAKTLRFKQECVRAGSSAGAHATALSAHARMCPQPRLVRFRAGAATSASLGVAQMAYW